MCTAPAHGTAKCTGTGCDFDCDLNYHKCGASCVSNTDPNTCGARCSPCPTTGNGAATCDGTNCGIQCNATYHYCSEGTTATCRLNTTLSACVICTADPPDPVCRGCTHSGETGCQPVCGYAPLTWPTQSNATTAACEP